jgi:hypothetical protein
MHSLDTNLLEKLYVIERKSSYEIAQIFGISSDSVRYKLRKLGVRIRNGGECHTLYNQDELFFDGGNNSYWAGFIAADGYITKDHNPRLAIGIAKQDLKLLEKFKSVTSYCGPIEHTPRRVQLRITCPRWIQDLKTFWNITQNKTYSLKPPKIKNLEQNLEYIIGFIDGDGHIGIDSRNTLRFNITSNFEILDWISHILYTIEDKSKYLNRLTIGQGHGNCFTLSAASLRAFNLLSILAKMPTPFRLSRKWNKLQEFECLKV